MPISTFNPFENIREVFNSGTTPSGLNVTIPYKKAVIPYLDQLTEEAKTIQAVNTIVIEASGKTIGHNTDHVGFQKALLKRIEKKTKTSIDSRNWRGFWCCTLCFGSNTMFFSIRF